VVNIVFVDFNKYLAGLTPVSG